MLRPGTIWARRIAGSLRLPQHYGPLPETFDHRYLAFTPRTRSTCLPKSVTNRLAELRHDASS